jgi:phosphodiesterase/alkaline phosphatase D-like protein
MYQFLDASPDYQFTVCNSNKTSPVGRTKTIPAKNDKTASPIRIAVYSCSNYRQYALEPDLQSL